MKSVLDRFNIKLVDEGILIYAEQGSRQDVKVLQELVTVLGALLDFAQHIKVKSRHLGSLARALDDEDRVERREKFEAECENVFEMYSTKLKELQDKEPSTEARLHWPEARKFIREKFNLTFGQTLMMISEGRRQMKAREKPGQEAKPRRKRRQDRLDSSLQKYSGRRAEKLFAQKRRLAKTEKVMHDSA